MGHDFTLPFQPPTSVSLPTGGLLGAPLPRQREGLHLPGPAKLETVLDKVYASGYPDTMIIQDFIPGDDSYMRVLTNYSDRNGKVKFMCLGHVLLEEHTPTATATTPSSSTSPAGPSAEKIRAFLEDIGYVGFSNFDIKYDQRDGKYKFFEINCRQGRKNYYVTGAGVQHRQAPGGGPGGEKDLPFVLADRPSLWRVVPRKVAFTYIVSDYHQQMRELMRQGRRSAPCSTTRTSP